MKRILFIGDSITDADRNKENPAALGRGYVALIGGELGADHPGEYEVLNRGVSGNKITQIFSRVKMDWINLKPDLATLLVGINDVWSEIKYQNGVDAPKYELIFDRMLFEVRKALPEMKLILMAPFVLEGRDTKNAPEWPGRWDILKKEVAVRAEICRRMAEKHGASFLPLQPVFDQALLRAPGEIWLADGVHPTPQGAALIKNEWLKLFNFLSL